MSANTPTPTDPVNQWMGDMMILQGLADSDCVNDQEREVLARWMAASKPPADGAALSKATEGAQSAVSESAEGQKQ